MKVTAEEKERMKQWYILNKEMHYLRQNIRLRCSRSENKMHPCKQAEKMVDFFIKALDRCEQDCLSPSDIQYTRLLKEHMVACYSVTERWIEQFNKENDKKVYTGVKKVKNKDEPDKWVFVGVKKVKKIGRPRKGSGMRVGLSNTFLSHNTSNALPTRPQ